MIKQSKSAFLNMAKRIPAKEGLEKVTVCVFICDQSTASWWWLAEKGQELLSKLLAIFLNNIGQSTVSSQSI